VPESLPEPAATPEIAVPDARRADGGPSRAVVLAEVVLASGFPTQLALGALLLLAGLAPFGQDGRLSMRYLLVLMPADTALLLAIVVWRLRASGESVSGVLFGTRRWARECWLGVGLVPLVLGAVIATMALLRAAWPWLHNVDANPFEALITSRTNALVLGALVIVAGGIKEEVQRAFVLHRFGQSLGGVRVGLALYSLAFGAGHVIQGYDVGIVTAALGLAWGMVFLWRRSIVAASVSHAGFNAAQILQFVVFGA
jgi:membrane protease YdiL (CAAX protease family)